MSHQQNFLRDLYHWKPGGLASPGWAVNGDINNDNVYFNGDAIVYQTQASMHQQIATISPLGNYSTAGLLISQPVVDATPYRVKANVCSYEAFVYLCVGYGPEAPTGSADLATKCRYFPLQISGSKGSGAIYGPAAQFDETILIPGVPEGDPDFAKPMFFGIMCAADGNPVAGYYLSVQNLAKTAPQFAASMS